MLLYISNDFVTKSVVNGQSWESIIKNYLVAVKSAVALQDFPSIVLLNEINKILSTTKDTLESVFTQYLMALGSLYGFSHIAQLLAFDGSATLEAVEGLKACYLCSENGVPAPWNIYMEYFDDPENITESTAAYFLRGLIIERKEERLNRIAANLNADASLVRFKAIFRQELQVYPDQEYIERLKNNHLELKKLMKITSSKSIVSKSEIEEMANEILGFEYMHEKENKTLRTFFKSIRRFTSDEDFIKSLISKFKGKNWFYNWMIYKLKILSIVQNQNITTASLKDAFQYLSYHAEPFLGKPRACDLYSIHNDIYESFASGLALINTVELWEYSIDILRKVSEGTTTSMQGSISGPLATDSLFKLLSEFVCKENLNKTISVLETLSKDKQGYHYHSNIAEYEFTLCILKSKAGERDKALVHFNDAVKYALAYTYRKDSTLDDVITAIEHYATFDPTKGLSDLKQIKALADSVLDHTDGKGTQYYIGSWFSKYISVNFLEASLYLLYELKRYVHNWIAEDCLADLLLKANCLIDPVIEAYIACTLPCERSEKFQMYCVKLSDTISTNSNIGNALLSTTLSNISIDDNHSSSSEFLKLVASKSEKHKIKVSSKQQRQSRNSNYVDHKKPIVIECEDRKEFSDMSTAELIEWFSNGENIQKNLNALCVLFNSFDDLNPDVKELIKSLVLHLRYSTDDSKPGLEVIFSEPNDTTCYYLVSRFVLEAGGWFERLTKIEMFKDAFNYNSKLALQFLFDLLPRQLDIGFNRDFSANLIRLLIELKFDKQVISKMWANLFDITSYRLPNQDKEDWQGILENNLNMNQREILLCILLTRFRASTAERVHFVIAGLTNILKYESNLTIKPFKWFLQNRDKFQFSQILIIIQFIYEQDKIDIEFKANFQNELLDLYPTRYATIDILVECLLKKPPLQYLEVGDIHYPLKKNEKDFYLHFNYRHAIFTSYELDLDQVFAKHQATWQDKYKHLFDIYANRFHKIMVPHTYSSEYLLELINRGYLSNKLKNWATENESSFTKSVCIDLKAIAAQTNSLTFRPENLIRPWDSISGDNLCQVNTDDDWILLAHFEREHKAINHYELLLAKNMGGIVFSQDKEQLFPYSPYRLHPATIWTDSVIAMELDDAPSVAYIQDDPLENSRLLWLNPNLVQILNLNVSDPADGLYATNESNEVVLKFECWSLEYLGTNHSNSLHDEMPKLTGSALFLRKDYFTELCKFYDEQPQYYTYNIKSQGEETASN